MFLKWHQDRSHWINTSNCAAFWHPGLNHYAYWCELQIRWGHSWMRGSSGRQRGIALWWEDFGVWQSVSTAGPRSTCNDPAEEFWDGIEFRCQHIYRTSVNEAHLFATFSQMASHSDREYRSLLFLLQNWGTNSQVEHWRNTLNS